MSGWTRLQGGGRPNEQPQALSHQRGLRGQRQEHHEAKEVRRLRRHPVHDAAVHQREDDLQPQHQRYLLPHRQQQQNALVKSSLKHAHVCEQLIDLFIGGL